MLVQPVLVPFGLAWGWDALGAGASWWGRRVALAALALRVLAHEALHIHCSAPMPRGPTAATPGVAFGLTPAAVA